MDDLMQQARELLESELKTRGTEGVAALLRDVIFAMRAAPEIFAPEVTDEMVEAAHAAYWAHPDDNGEDRPCIRAALEAALAARPPAGGKP